jgi:hypothetical protein
MLRLPSLHPLDQSQSVRIITLLGLNTDHLDTKNANSKYYNPYTFDPQQDDYQQDVRLAVRDELPTHIDSSDVAENMYAYMFMTEMTWPSLFFGTWAAFEPDVSYIISFIITAHHPLPLGEGSPLP